MRYLSPLAMAFAFVASASSAATVTDIQSGERGEGRRIELNENDFTGSGSCGYGGSVVNDGCSVIGKIDPDANNAYGRFDPFDSAWIDSSDLSRIEWVYEAEKAFTSLTFAITDAFDQSCSDVLGCSYFRLLAGDLVWDISEKQDNGELNWITLLFDEPTFSTVVNFETRLNDGFGISLAQLDAPPAPVPLPAALPLLGAALAALFGVRSYRGKGGIWHRLALFLGRSSDLRTRRSHALARFLDARTDA